MIRILFIYLLCSVFANLSACRLWAVCAKTGFALSTLPSNHKALVLENLEYYFEQSRTMPNGWALLNYDSIPTIPTTSVFRSSITAYNDSLNYWEQVGTLIDSGQNRIGVGHLRMASSGANNIPNPHPWMFHYNDQPFSLVHNGTINKSDLFDIITNNGSDLSWLDQNNPNTFNGLPWSSSEGWSSVVDSNLLLLLIMQIYVENENLYEAIKESLIKLLNSGTNANQINIIMSNGLELYIFGGPSGLSIMETSTHFTVMTQPNVYNDFQNYVWSEIYDSELIIINKSGISRFPNFIETSIDDESNPQKIFTLKPAYPNPFNEQITIPFQIQSLGNNARLSIYSIIGEKVFNADLNQNQINQGFVKWNPLNNSQMTISSGPYIVRIESNKMSSTKKILFIK
ncbi:MAG: T9SS type A sorting domain-containing protein [Candidatus Neomarinimicrobiota bacterium]